MDSSNKQDKEVSEGRFFAMIAYVSFLCIISLLLKKDNKFVLFHAKQGLVLFVFEVICFILSILPLVGTIIKGLGILAFTLLSIWGVWQSFRGQCGRIPFISKFSDKISL